MLQYFEFLDVRKTEVIGIMNCLKNCLFKIEHTNVLLKVYTWAGEKMPQQGMSCQDVYFCIYTFVFILLRITHHLHHFC